MGFSSEEKLTRLSEAARFDLSCACGAGDAARRRDPADPMYKWIYPAALPDGGTLPVLKVLLTNLCFNKCRYCAVCTRKDSGAVSFVPDELALLFMQMVSGRLARGLFLSSGTGKDAARTMDAIISTADILRSRYRFAGYIHLKILPGAEYAQIEKALQLANRVSINLEAPNSKRLDSIADGKNFVDIIRKIKNIDDIIRDNPARRRSQTTQFVVGAAGESDREILTTTKTLYSDYNMSRTYYSAFQPAEDTSLDGCKPVPLIREHRLYQADFLFRKYGFEFGEIVFDGSGNLPLNRDPKTLWAVSHPEEFPLEVNRACPEKLLRVPGIGPVAARRIVAMRKKNRFSELRELKSTGMRIEQAREFLLVNGRFFPRPRQLELVL